MKKIANIRKSSLSRGLFALKSAAKVLPKTLSLKEQTPELLLKSLIGNNIDRFVDDVGALKGSVLKAAQMLSSYGEYYLPEEANQLLRKVQSQSHYLPWNKVKGLIPDQLHREFTIEQTPIAAASIGQVHRASLKSSGEHIALKIQYPGVRKAIDLDIKILKSFLSLTKILPKRVDMTEIYGEIKKVLTQEMDYTLEVTKHLHYQKLLSGIQGYYIPKVYQEFCSEQVIATEYIQGPTLGEVSRQQLSQEERNKLGERLLYLYFYEIFRGNLIQTDCHGGNFLLRKEQGDLQLALIDYGACLYFDDKTMSQYRSLMSSLYQQNKELFFKHLSSIMHETGGRHQFAETDLWEYCLLATSPMQEESFDWGNTNLPDKLYEKAQHMISRTHLEKPPHQFIFLDRKLLGIFSLLNQLGPVVNMKALVQNFMETQES